MDDEMCSCSTLILKDPRKDQFKQQQHTYNISINDLVTPYYTDKGRNLRFT